MKIIGEKLEDLKKLDSDFDWCVILPPGTDVSKIPLSRFDVESNFQGGFVVTAKPKSYRSYVKNLLEELKKFPDETQTVRSFGKIASERATIHHVAYDLNLTIGCTKSNATFLVSLVENKGERPKPWWVKKLIINKPVAVEHPGTPFTNFRGQVYRWAKTNDKSITVFREGNQTLVKLNGGRSKSIQKRFNEFLDTIVPGDSVLLPDEFSEMKDGYIRVLLSNHNSKFSYRGGLITNETDSKDSTNHPDSTTPHIDSNGHFIMDGHNYGKKPDRWIQLKLKHTDWTLEDVRR